MFALFEGISNKLLVLTPPHPAPLPLRLFLSFMKMMIHCSALRSGQWRQILRQPTSPACVGKSPAVNQIHSAKLGENICLTSQHASLCACLDRARVDLTFFSLLSEMRV